MKNLNALHFDRVNIPESKLPDPVLTSRVPGLWRLEYEYRYDDEDKCIIVIPAGFEFDLASVPRPIWWLIAPFELSIAAPLIHDYHYENKGMVSSHNGICVYSRKESDDLFLEIMKKEGVSLWRRSLAYAAVRLVGWRYW